MNKPPLGIMPHKLWLEERINELIAAIDRSVKVQRMDKVSIWIQELEELCAVYSKKGFQ